MSTLKKISVIAISLLAMPMLCVASTLQLSSTWYSWGNPNIGSQTFGTSLVMNGDNTPYLLTNYENGGPGSLNVYALDNGTWVPETKAPSSINSIAINSDSAKATPYITYSNAADTSVEVAHLVNNKWVALPTVTKNAYVYYDYNLSLKVSKDGVPYIFYLGSKGAVLKKFVVGKWQTIGNPLLAGYAGCGAKTLDLQLTQEGTPEAIIYDHNNNGVNNLVVEKLTNNQWQQVGHPLTIPNETHPNFAIAKNGQPFVAVSQPNIVYTLDQSNQWVSVAGTSEINPSFSVTSIGVSKNNTPYITLTDGKLNTYQVYRYQSNQWVQLGQTLKNASGWTPVVFNKNNEAILTYSSLSNSYAQVNKLVIAG